MNNFNEILNLLQKPLFETLYMVFFSSFFSVLIGSFLGIYLFISKEGGIKENLFLNKIVGNIINIFRSFPFIILMIVLFPFTKLIVGTKIGTTAAIVPLSVAGAPFFARLMEASLNKIDSGIIEALISMGQSEFTIIKVLLREALSFILLDISNLVINILAYSAICGSIGAGGLGDLAIIYGYQRWNVQVMTVTVILIILLVIAIQSFFEFTSRKIKHS